MDLQIYNYVEVKNEITQKKAISYVNSLIDNLKEHRISEDIRITDGNKDNKDMYASIEIYIGDCVRSEKKLDPNCLLLKMNNKIDKKGKCIIITGSLYELPGYALYGACDTLNGLENPSKLCVIRKLDEKVFWHEIAHLLGVADHYDYNEKTGQGDPNNRCSYERNSHYKDCIMQYNPLESKVFCQKAYDEFKKWLN